VALLVNALPSVAFYETLTIPDLLFVTQIGTFVPIRSRITAFAVAMLHDFELKTWGWA
jgi:hypothetical protein